MQIGPYQLPNNLILAPMAGVTDRPFRQLCRRFGAGMVVSEMVTSDQSLWHTRKSSLRMNHSGEPEPISVQIAGSEPAMLAAAAQANVERGAQIIDINMGCPAKKVCNKAAGSALLADEKLVASILSAVVAAVDVPVTLKIRTGLTPENRNGLQIAKIAESEGIQALAVHGRTRKDLYKGEAEYETIAAIKAAVSIPIIANGDITSATKAKYVLEKTSADAIMIGRGAHGQPWLFAQIGHFLATGAQIFPPSSDIISKIIDQHLQALYAFYGADQGLRIARKHIRWYGENHPALNDQDTIFNKVFWPTVTKVTDAEEQRQLTFAFFAGLGPTEIDAAESIQTPIATARTKTTWQELAA